MKQPQTPSLTAALKTSTPRPAVIHFDSLPDSGRIRVAPSADVLGVSVPTLYRLVKTGKLPALRKIGGTSGFNVGELRAVLAGMQA